MALNRKGTLLVTGGSGPADVTIKLWSLPTGKHLTTVSEHKRDVNSLAMNESGTILASSTGDNIRRLWSLPDIKLKTTLRGGPYDGKYVGHIAMSPDGKTLGIGSSLWSVPAGKSEGLLIIPPGPGKRVTRSSIHRCGRIVAFSPDGKLFAARGSKRNGGVELWSLATRKPKIILADARGGQETTFSPDSRYVASSDAKKGVGVWGVQDGKRRMTFPGDSAAITCTAFSPNGKLLAVGRGPLSSSSSRWSNNLKIYSLTEKKLLMALTGHGGRITGLAFMPSGKMLVSAGSDGRVFLWELEGQKRLWLLFDPYVDQPYREFSGYCRKEGTGDKAVCTCNAIWQQGKTPLPKGEACVCDIIWVGKKSSITLKREMTAGKCTCDEVCVCNKVGGGGTIHYWYPT
jgi:WD40 repeat protein